MPLPTTSIFTRAGYSYSQVLVFVPVPLLALVLALVLALTLVLVLVLVLILELEPLLRLAPIICMGVGTLGNIATSNHGPHCGGRP